MTTSNYLQTNLWRAARQRGETRSYREWLQSRHSPSSPLREAKSYLPGFLSAEPPIPFREVELPTSKNARRNQPAGKASTELPGSALEAGSPRKALQSLQKWLVRVCARFLQSHQGLRAMSRQASTAEGAPSQAPDSDHQKRQQAHPISSPEPTKPAANLNL